MCNACARLNNCCADQAAREARRKQREDELRQLEEEEKKRREEREARRKEREAAIAAETAADLARLEERRKQREAQREALRQQELDAERELEEKRQARLRGARDLLSPRSLAAEESATSATAIATKPTSLLSPRVPSSTTSTADSRTITVHFLRTLRVFLSLSCFKILV